MSIIIKGIDMPKEGTAVRIAILYNGQVFLDNGVGKPTYQAVEIPTPHGRLIEGDRLIRELSVIADRPIRSGMYIIKEAPTILEAEE